MAPPLSPEAPVGTMRRGHIGEPIFRVIACIAAVIAITALLFVIHVQHDRLLSAALNLFLVVVLTVSIRWGTGYAIFVSLLSALAFSLSLPPAGHFHLRDARVWTLITACLVTGFVAGQLSGRARREAQNARRSERELRDVIETIPAMAWSALPDGSSTFMSRRWTEYIGLSAADTTGPGWQAALHPKILRGIPKSGAPQWVRVSLSKMRRGFVTELTGIIAGF